MSRRSFPFIIDHTGEVVGAYAAQPAAVTVHGWAFSNSAAAIGNVAFYIPTPATAGSGRNPALPSAGGVLLFSIDVAVTNQSKEFFGEGGIYFKDGLYCIASATTTTGCLFIS